MRRARDLARRAPRIGALGLMLGLMLGLGVFSTPSQPPRPQAPLDEIEDLVIRERFVPAFARAIEQARQLAERDGPLAPETLAALERVGTIAFHGGALDVAQRIVERTLETNQALHAPDSLEVAASLLARARVARVAAERDLARSSLERALAIVETHGRTHTKLYADLLSARANWLRRVDLEAAIVEYERALAVRLTDPAARESDVADDLTWLGWSLFHGGRHAEADARFAEAEDRLRAAGLAQGTNLAVLLSARADAAAIRESWAEAERLYRTSTRIFDTVRSGYFPGFPRAKSPRHGYPELALAVLHQGRETEAFELLERGRGTITAEFLDLGRWRDVDPQGHAEAQRLRQRWIAAERASRTRDVDPQQQIRRLLDALGLYAQLLAAEQRYLDRDEPEDTMVAHVRAALGPSEAYVGWVRVTWADHHNASDGPSRTEVWAYVVRPDGVRWLELEPLEDRWLQYVVTVQRAASWPLRVDPDDELRALGRELGRALVEPVVRHLEGVDRLFVELSEVAPVLPVESLPLSDGTCLKERYTVSYVSSARAYVQGKSDARPVDITDRPALVIGDPRLPYARREVESVATLFPQATVRSGRAASRAEIERLAGADRLREFGVVHLAAHMITPWLHERAGVRLDEEVVELPEILAGWHLDADLVTLSGCRSMSGHVFPDRSEYLGLPQALFAAGARAVVASMWEIEDEAAALLMRRFYENLTTTEPMSIAQALREASLWLRAYEDETGARPFEHPVYWSGFIVLGAP